MNKNILALRYAKGIVACIPRDENLEEKFLSLLSEFTALLSSKIRAGEDSLEILLILTTPRLQRSMQENLLEQIFSKLDADDIFKIFVLLLFRKGRLELCETILIYCSELIDQRNNRITGRLRSANSLDRTTVERLKKIFSEKYAKDISLQPEVTPSLLGGLVVRIKDTVFDGSLSNSLQRFVNSF